MRCASTCRDRLPVWASCAGVLLLAGTLQAGAQPVFRSQIDLVTLQVSVVDEGGSYVRNLTMEDFAVFEEGVAQPISVFAASDSPVDLMILIDTSASMINRLPTVKRAAINFVHALEDGDRAAVVLFNHRIRVTQKLTSDRAKLEMAIRRASTSGQTALHDALYVALKELTGRPRDRRELRRQAVVVLTDGDDTASRVSMEDVFGIARGHTVTVYAVTPPEGRTIDHGGRLTGPLFDLRALTRETGGRTFTPARMEDLNTVYGEIAAELRHQYWVAYAPQHAPGPFRRVSVSIVNQPALQVRTRSGYMLGKPARETPDRSRERD